jgi:hypothetical protein
MLNAEKQMLLNAVAVDRRLKFEVVGGADTQEGCRLSAIAMTPVS